MIPQDYEKVKTLKWEFIFFVVVHTSDIPLLSNENTNNRQLATLFHRLSLLPVMVENHHEHGYYGRLTQAKRRYTGDSSTLAQPVGWV